ncbi:MAG: DUF177 domain-containing protein [Actinomycetota bacterium]
MPGLVFDVSEMVGRAGATRNVRRGVAISGLQGPLGGIGEDESVHLDLSLDSVTEGIVASGTIRGTLHLSCSRCLVGYDRSFEQLVDETFFVRPAQDGPEAEVRDGYAVQDNHVDLEPMLRDVIVLGIPTVPLHDEGCRGLCQTCGADRNLTECGHSQQLDDLRWAPLQALRGALGGLERSS